MTSKSFPRGGKKPPTQVKEKKKRPTKKVELSKPTTLDLTPSATAPLTTSTLYEGMLILGCVSHCNDYDIAVALPGRLRGHVQAVDVSEAYTNILQDLIKSPETHSAEYKALSDLYKCRDHVVCCVKQIKTDPKFQIILSLEPQLINQNLDPSKLQKGSKIACTISSVEDHGYVVDTGIKTLRGFLAHKNVDDGSQLYPGKQIFCSVTNVKSVDNTVTVELTSKSKHTQSLTNTSSQSLDSITPGTHFNLRIKKIMSNGLQVTFNEDNLGYINQIYLLHSLETYSEGAEILGVFQYIVPTVKLAYFSELLPNREQQSSVAINEIITNAKVLFRTSNGFVLRLKKGVRGFVAFSHTGVAFADIPTKFLRKSAHRCRVTAYDDFDQLYIVTMLPERLKDDFSVAESVEIGDILSVKITQITLSGFILVECGKILGCITPMDITDADKVKIGDTLKTRVIGRNKMDNGWMFTTKKELVNSQLPVLADINEACIGAKYHATVIVQKDNGLLVLFFNNVKGWISEKTLTAASKSPYDYPVGQIVVVKIDTIIKEKNKLYVSIVSNDNEVDWNLKIGQYVEGSVVDASTEGIYLKISNADETAVKTGFLPSGHMAPCPNLGRCLAINFHPGEKISAMVFSTSPEFLLTRTFVPGKKFTTLRTLELGDCIPCSFKDIDETQVHVILPTSDIKSHGIVPIKKIDRPEFLLPYQVLFGRIYSLNKEEPNRILISMLAPEVRFKTRADEHPMIAVIDALTLYLGKIKELSTFFSDEPLGSMSLGQCVSGTVEKVTDNGIIVLLENQSTAIVRAAHYKGKIKVGQSVTGVVLWLDYENQLVELSLQRNLVHTFSQKQCKLPVDTLLTGEILYISPWIILAALKGSKKRTIVALPAKSHVNDLNPDLSPYQIGNRIRCYVILNKDEAELLPICVLKSTFDSLPRIETSEALKEKAVNNDLLLRRLCLKSDTPKKAKKKPVKEVKDSEKVEKVKKIKKRKQEETAPISPKKIKLEEVQIQENTEQEEKIVEEVTTTVPIAKTSNVGIPECGFFWDTTADESLKIKEEPSSASEDEPEEEDEPKAKKAKKLSAAERRDLEKQTERELRDREAVLTSNQAPQSADQYDRLVLASPDSSLIWIQYMAFHLQAAEIDKARAVANRALKTINYREETEKLNVWKAWLNLESRFGSPETLKSVFQEALVVNDPLSVQLHMLTIHADAKRQSELEKTVRAITGKFKQVPQAWMECGEALLKMGLKDQSIFTMQRATQSLPPKEHVNILARFAHLHAQYNDMDTALTLFEQILSSYPARVDIWSAYVDIYVKNGDYDGARKVLQKAVVQTLPPRKMKTFFKKYLAFEEQHGTPEGVAHVRQLTTDYVEKKCKNPGN